MDTSNYLLVPLNLWYGLDGNSQRMVIVSISVKILLQNQSLTFWKFNGKPSDPRFSRFGQFRQRQGLSVFSRIVGDASWSRHQRVAPIILFGSENEHAKSVSIGPPIIDWSPWFTIFVRLHCVLATVYVSRFTLHLHENARKQRILKLYLVLQNRSSDGQPTKIFQYFC